jgi:tetratricopeptide (TPR) repeat protein
MGNECLYHAHNTRAALANYDKAIELNPRHADAYVQKGISLQNDGQNNEALTAYNRAIEPQCRKLQSLLQPRQMLPRDDTLRKKQPPT